VKHAFKALVAGNGSAQNSGNAAAFILFNERSSIGGPNERLKPSPIKFSGEFEVPDRPFFLKRGQDLAEKFP
jgi:hypothetical protein